MLVRPSKPSTGATFSTATPWTWSQQWLDVLFLHWKVPPDAMQLQLPTALEVETQEDLAWVSIVLFRLKVRPRWLPSVPGFSSLTEINVRTYVRYRGKPGIYFLSMFAENAWAIWAAKLLTPLPYVQSPISYRSSSGNFSVESGAFPGCGTALSLQFQSMGESRTAAAGSRDEWLLERYRAFAPDRRGRMLSAEVRHPPWVVQDVSIAAHGGSDSVAFGPAPARPPDAMHFSDGVQATFGHFYF